MLVSTEAGIVCIQEHRLQPSQLHEPASLVCISSSAMTQRVAAGPIVGLGNGGLAIFFRRSAFTNIKRIYLDSNRVLAASFSFHGQPVNIVNIYIPWNSSKCAEAFAEYLQCITNMCSVPNNNIPCFIAGDYNIDFRRNDIAGSIVMDQLADVGLCFADTSLSLTW